MAIKSWWREWLAEWRENRLWHLGLLYLLLMVGALALLTAGCQSPDPRYRPVFREVRWDEGISLRFVKDQQGVVYAEVLVSQAAERQVGDQPMVLAMEERLNWGVFHFHHCDTEQRGGVVVYRFRQSNEPAMAAADQTDGGQ